MGAVDFVRSRISHEGGAQCFQGRSSAREIRKGRRCPVVWTKRIYFAIL
jgi:hypothetical protein